MENNKIKYPRTFHLPFSEGVSSDDKTLKDLSCFEGKEIIVSEKLDGENSTLMRDCMFARSLDSNNHPSRNWVKGLWGTIKHDIPKDWRVCGENLYAKHSIDYNNLESYFYCFNIWDEKNVCLSWDDTVIWSILLGLEVVPVIYRGVFDIEILKNLKIDPDKQEGFVVRLSDSFKYEDFNKSVAKWVRKGHVQTDKHWSTQKMEINKLKNK